MLVCISANPAIDRRMRLEHIAVVIDDQDFDIFEASGHGVAPGGGQDSGAKSTHPHERYAGSGVGVAG